LEQYQQHRQQWELVLFPLGLRVIRALKEMFRGRAISSASVRDRSTREVVEAGAAATWYMSPTLKTYRHALLQAACCRRVMTAGKQYITATSTTTTTAVSSTSSMNI
jgi:hypothetical protein